MIIYGVYDVYTSSKEIIEYFSSREKAEEYTEKSTNRTLLITEIEVNKMTVYIVVDVQYDGVDIEEVFSTREKAEAYAQNNKGQFNADLEIIEMEVL